jgi:hypothetical protein
MEEFADRGKRSSLLNYDRKRFYSRVTYFLVGLDAVKLFTANKRAKYHSQRKQKNLPKIGIGRVH